MSIYFLSSLVFTSGCFKAVMDTLQFHFSTSIFRNQPAQFWNPAVSWINKYTNSVTLAPKFFGSTTFLVFLTDAWHFFQTFFLEVFFISLVLYKPYFTEWHHIPGVILDYVLLRSIFGISYTLFYNYILLKK
jgi:hypothetical protein